MLFIRQLIQLYQENNFLNPRDNPKEHPFYEMKEDALFFDKSDYFCYFG
jgi:hypothetical protein